jgi:hypothetical protein
VGPNPCFGFIQGGTVERRLTVAGVQPRKLGLRSAALGLG